MGKDSPIQKDVIIIGAGAAGLMCAIEAGKRGRSVLLLEHNEAVGKKIRISGGGRCNFTNLHTTAGNFISKNPHFAKSALARFGPQEFCKMVENHKIPFHEKKLGQLFCDKSAQDIIGLLKKECLRYGVDIFLGAKVMDIAPKDFFSLTTPQQELRSQSLVIATGGLSVPSLGATNMGYQIAQKFDIKVNPCKPGLVPLTLQEKDLRIFKDLSGVSLDALVSFENRNFRENILFTHKGLSGPAILQISSYWEPKKPLSINLVPDHDMSAVLKARRTATVSLKNFLKDYLPLRLADVLCDHFLENKPLNNYSLDQLQKTGNRLNNWEIIPEGTEGYAKAEVTVGGIDTDELSSKTMETKKIPGLYFIGEVVDVTGHLGGFNFQWAWASGFAAGQYA
ncbi:MAG: NAD(P)/FAD-dependent oxidoreductase [Candidatus Omnitrophica bacterium]|nr:NAD(P)/FAD-dependent oxidoreductase [Candidatus Omnitrophota bacterium]